MESKLIKGLNEQYNFEVSSGYIYYSMANYVKDKGMDGFAHFFNKQAEEEFAQERRVCQGTDRWRSRCPEWWHWSGEEQETYHWSGSRQDHHQRGNYTAPDWFCWSSS